METQNNDQALKEMIESRDALESILVNARKIFIKDLEALKMGYDVVKVIDYVLRYPNNHDMLLKKDAQGHAAASGTAYMQIFSEYNAVNKILALHELEQANKTKGESNDIQSTEQSN